MRILPKTRSFLLAVSAAACGAIGISSIVGCRPNRGPSPEVQAFWDKFLATNSAWLSPAPGPLYYELTLQQKEYVASSNSYQWREAGFLKTWCTPEKNLRIFHEYQSSDHAPWRTNEHRYFHGKGDQVSLKPRGSLRDLSLDVWLAARVGAGFLTRLHLCAAWGLPKGATLRDDGGLTVSLLLTNQASRSREWHREMMVDTAYGMHPAVFASETKVLADTVEVTTDRASLLPRELVEKTRDGRVCSTVTFDSTWLDFGGRMVPRKIQSEFPGQGCRMTYEFAVEQGVWLLKEFTRDCPSSYSLCARALLRKLRVGPIPDDWFPSPANLNIPERSVTDCAPGERIVIVRTADGLSLEAKLSLPGAIGAPAAAVLFLPGAGPWTFDRPLVYPDFAKLDDMLPDMRVYNYCDFYARELSARGIGFFRMNKRGCGIVRDEQGHPREICNRSLFAQATPSVLLEDYKAALRTLKQEAGVDAQRIVLLGASEGTRLAARLAAECPDGVRAVVMLGYAGDNTRDTLTYQNTIGPWRNVAKLFDTDNNAQITRAEYDEVVRLKGKALAQALPFAELDRNRNGTITPNDMNHRPRLDQILRAVDHRDDDYLWDNLLQLSSAYLLEDWDSPPLHQTLLRLKLPLAIFHGKDDGACRVECVLETQQAFRKAGQTNLTIHIYPKTNHDLDWTQFLKDEKPPAAFRDVFEYIQVHCQDPSR